MEDPGKSFQQVTFQKKPKILASQNIRGSIRGDRIAGQMPGVVGVGQEWGEWLKMSLERRAETK